MPRSGRSRPAIILISDVFPAPDAPNSPVTRPSLEKHASTVSYGAYADCIVATARSSPEAEDYDEVTVLCLPPTLSLERPGTWDTLGLRGTCSNSYRIVAEGVNAQRGPDFTAIVITHYQRLLDHIVPDRVHVLAAGRIVRSGGPELAHELEAHGYADMIGADADAPDGREAA